MGKIPLKRDYYICQKGLNAMKKLFCLIIMIVIACTAACASAEENFTLWFEEGFSLDLPEGWVAYPADEESKDNDIRYILGNGEATRYMYILYRPTTFADMAELGITIATDDRYEKTGDLVFDGYSFIAFALPGQDVSGCMTLHEGNLLIFAYNPQSDSEYMMLAASIMDTFNSIA